MAKNISLINKKDMARLVDQGICSEDILDELAFLGAELVTNVLIAKNNWSKKDRIYDTLAALRVAEDIFVQSGRAEGCFKASLFDDLLEGEINRVKSQAEDCGKISFMPDDHSDWM